MPSRDFVGGDPNLHLRSGSAAVDMAGVFSQTTQNLHEVDEPSFDFPAESITMKAAKGRHIMVKERIAAY